VKISLKNKRAYERKCKLGESSCDGADEDDPVGEDGPEESGCEENGPEDEGGLGDEE
jgi:hypothetical protein